MLLCSAVNAMQTSKRNRKKMSKVKSNTIHERRAGMFSSSSCDSIEPYVVHSSPATAVSPPNGRFTSAVTGSCGPGIK